MSYCHSHISIPSYCHSPILPYPHALILSFPHTPIPSYYHSPILPYPHALILSFPHTPISPCPHTVIPPYSHIPYPHSPMPSYCHSLIPHSCSEEASSFPSCNTTLSGFPGNGTISGSDVLRHEFGGVYPLYVCFLAMLGFSVAYRLLAYCSLRFLHRP